MKKFSAGRWAVHAAAAAAFLVLGPAPLLAAVPPGAAAEILHLQGHGEQRPAAATDWQPARVAQPLAAGDYVRTRTGARMALLFADETQVRLHQNSMLQVKAVAAAPGSATTLLLQAGRAWAQTRRPPDRPLQLQTPAATAGIRGTDWEIEVGPDGRTLLTVLSGEVSLANPQGEVRVGRNEAAIAEVGRAPVKIQLTAPRDRVQWVTMLAADPGRHLSPQAPAELADIARQIQSGETQPAQQGLQALLAGAQPPLAAWLLLADLQLAGGDFNAAIATLQQGLQRQPGQPLLRAELARAQVLADRLEQAQHTLGEPQADDPAPLWLARGALARRQGDVRATLRALAEAQARAPADDRAWFGLGSAQTEREDTAAARPLLAKALELNPQGPGYRGELGTLETLRNDWPAAEAAFAQALADNPGDYVALTGLGLLRLKQGEPQQALDALLRAGVLEPRYARAKAWTGVAYWQLGRRDDAVATLQQAAALDPKDPLPHLLLAQVYTDLFRAGDALASARAGVERLPYLKSLNQLANDQQGRANLGAAVAFFGLEDWAMELAQQSYHPYWGGSHLFLADRYTGEFNKNSELYQGFLADPLAFGASPRFTDLLQRPGRHGIVGLTLDREHGRLANPYVTVNGLGHAPFPVAWLLKAQPAVGTRYPIEVGASGVPARYDTTGRADLRARIGTLGVGARPTESLGLFAYYNDTSLSLSGRNRVELIEGMEDSAVNSSVATDQRQAAAGLSWRWSPQAQTWVKLGHSLEFTDASGYPALVQMATGVSPQTMYSVPQKRFTDLQLRHTVDLEGGTRLAFGAEHVKERQYNEMASIGPMQLDIGGFPVTDYLVLSGRNDIDRRFSALTVAAQQPLAPGLKLDAALTANWIRHRVHGNNSFVLLGLETGGEDVADRDDTERVLAPRLGLVWQPNSRLTVRAAWQDWLRPLSVSTLNPVDTAGIPLEDRLVEAGGRQRRAVVQASLALDERSFLSARLDHLRIDNPESPGVDLRTPSLPFLEDLRNAQLINLSSIDLLEATPSFQRGRLTTWTVGASRLLTPRLSGYLRYAHHASDSSYADSNAPDGRSHGKQIPWLPRHLFVAGATWASEQRLYLSARAVWRSQRFEDKENLTPRPAGWGLDLAGFWESADKHWLVGVGALNLVGRQGERQARRYVIDARYRF